MYAGSDAQMLQFPPRPLVMERRWKSNVELAPNCPRCASPNTKFCYYNNYSLSQPRYFCKACRRYWTKGGSLRNVPVGGGCRKNRRAKAFRPSQDDGLSVVTSAVGSSSCPTGYDTSALIAPLSRGCDRDGGSDIDLAAVFAKFLNQNSSRGGEDGNCNDNGSPALLGLPGNSNLDTHLEETMVKCQTPSSVSTNQESNRFVLGIPPALVAGGGGDQDRQEERIQEFLDRDPTSFGLQSIHDEISQDLLWSDDATTLPNFGWQPATAQLPELGSFPFEDQSKISANILGDNWCLFDLSAYEIFTRP